MSKETEIPLIRQQACAERELAMRRRVYPRWVAQGKMSAAYAREELESMDAIVQTLRKLRGLAESSQAMLKLEK